MSRSIILLCLAATPSIGQAARVNIKNYEEESAGQDKCTVQWDFNRPEDTWNAGQVASVSFAVKSCRIECKKTNSDYGANKMLSQAFSSRQDGRFCLCAQAATPAGEAKELFKYVGKCPNDEVAAQKKCFDQYKVLVTDRWVPAWKGGEDQVSIEHNPNSYLLKMFDYNEIACVKGGCSGDACPRASLPTLYDSHSDEEKELVKNAIAKAGNSGAPGSTGGGAGELPDAVKNIIEAMSPDEAHDLMPEIVGMDEKTNHGSGLTVEALRIDYTQKFSASGTELSVDHLLRLAGFDPDTPEGLAKEVTDDELQRFLNPVNTC